MTRIRSFTLAAAGSLLLAGASGAGLAHPHPGAEDGDGKEVRKFVVIHDGKGDGKAAGHSDRRVRRFAIHGAGMVDCDDGEKIVDEASGEGDRKTKVVICTRGKPSAATAERLEEALGRIDENDHLSAEAKARIATALKTAIDRARSGR